MGGDTVLATAANAGFPLSRAGGKARSFVELQLLKLQNGAGIPAKRRGRKGNWRMGASKGWRGKVKAKKTIRNNISFLCQILWDFFLSGFLTACWESELLILRRPKQNAVAVG